MEFVEGRSLERVQEEAKGPLDETLVMGWAVQLCAVLHYLHTRPQPIIFRDMKPSNVMVTIQVPSRSSAAKSSVTSVRSEWSRPPTTAQSPSRDVMGSR